MAERSDAPAELQLAHLKGRIDQWESSTGLRITTMPSGPSSPMGARLTCPTHGEPMVLVHHVSRGPDERQATYHCPRVANRLCSWIVCRREWVCPACGTWCVDPLWHHAH
jgi:hypothetical protein